MLASHFHGLALDSLLLSAPRFQLTSEIDPSLPLRDMPLAHYESVSVTAICETALVERFWSAL